MSTLIKKDYAQIYLLENDDGQRLEIFASLVELDDANIPAVIARRMWRPASTQKKWPFQVQNGLIVNYYSELRTLGNIVTGNDQQTDAVLQNNALPVFSKLLRHSKSNIVKVIVS